MVANVGDSRAVICKDGVTKQTLRLSRAQHGERCNREQRRFRGDVTRVDGHLAVARAFGYKSLEMHFSQEPYDVDFFLI